MAVSARWRLVTGNVIMVNLSLEDPTYYLYIEVVGNSRYLQLSDKIVRMVEELVDQLSSTILTRVSSSTAYPKKLPLVHM